MIIKIYLDKESRNRTIKTYANYLWNSINLMNSFFLLILFLIFSYNFYSLLKGGLDYMDIIIDLFIIILVTYTIYYILSIKIKRAKEKNNYIDLYYNKLLECHITFTDRYIHFKTSEKELKHNWEDFKQYIFYKRCLFLSLKSEQKSYEYLIDISSLDKVSIQNIKNRLSKTPI